MKAYILSTGRRIAPFGDPVGESMIGNRHLAELQESILRRAGLAVERIEGPEQIRARRFLLTWDDVFFTRRVVDSLAARLRAGLVGVQALRCGLPADSLLVRKTSPLQDLLPAELDGERLALYRLFVCDCERPPASEAALRRLCDGARPFRARFKEKVIEIAVPTHIVGYPHYAHPLTSSVVMHLGHWVHVLWANQLSIQIRWVESILDHKAWVGWNLLRAACAAALRGAPWLPALKWSVGGGLNRIGRNCDIHPTARVELSQLGDHVRVGAYALVRGCLLDDGVQVEDRANLIFSVIGRDCFISKNSTLVFCAGYPEGDLCINGIQCSLFGREVALTSLVRVIDVKARGEIKVMHEGELRPAGTNFLGACFGHRSFAGLDVTIQSGRAVPNDTVLVKPPDEILRRFPPDLPPGVPVYVKDGTAVPLDAGETEGQ